MKKSLLIAFIEGLLLLLPFSLLAQEKTQAYYNSHENEILPDAQAAFRGGDYDRTVVLCRWHYIIVGDRAAEQLREKAEQCAQLSKEMEELQAMGKTEAALEKAKAILALNPDDEAAKALLPEEEPAPAFAPDTVVVMPPVENLGPTELVETNPPAQEDDDLEEEIATEPWPGWDTKPIGTEDIVPSQKEYRTRLVVKAGASILDMKQLSQTIAPGGAIGLYDLGGSRIGGELGGYLCPGLSSASLVGIDAALVIRAANGIYPKVGLGYFSCSPKESDGDATQGLCANVGLSFLLGGHLCLELGARYFPAVNVGGFETVTTAGATYDFPTSKSILAGGIAPMVSLGWGF